MTTAVIFDAQRFSLHDGPGIRTTLFMKGCPLSCSWCQNPEGKRATIRLWCFENLCARCGSCRETCPTACISHSDSGLPIIDHERCTGCGRCVRACDYAALHFDGRIVNLDELVRETMRDSRFFRETGGGVTFSGGEPLFQAAFVAQAAERFKADGVHVAVETSLGIPWRSVSQCMPFVDLFIVDLKGHDAESYQKRTGFDGAAALENFRRLASGCEGAGRILVRYTMIPRFHDEETLARIARLVRAADPALRIEIMNYNPLAVAKYRRLHDATYPFYHCLSPFPQEQVERCKSIVTDMGLTAL